MTGSQKLRKYKQASWSFVTVKSLTSRPHLWQGTNLGNTLMPTKGTNTAHPRAVQALPLSLYFGSSVEVALHAAFAWLTQRCEEAAVVQPSISSTVHKLINGS
jgi:hypothetical protein